MIKEQPQRQQRQRRHNNCYDSHLRRHQMLFLCICWIVTLLSLSSPSPFPSVLVEATEIVGSVTKATPTTSAAAVSNVVDTKANKHEGIIRKQNQVQQEQELVNEVQDEEDDEDKEEERKHQYKEVEALIPVEPSLYHHHDNHNKHTGHYHLRDHRILVDNSITCEQKNQMITSSCQSWDTFLQTTYGILPNMNVVLTNRIVIPCGICVILYHDSFNTKMITLYDGIDIQGKLIIDCKLSLNPKLLHIQTTLLLIQGYMEMDSTCQLPIENNPLIKITMISKLDNSTSTYTPIDTSVAATCINGGICNVGEKSITVTGYGQVNFTGISNDIPSWVKLYNVTYNPIISNTNPNGIVVTSNVYNRWTIGSMILITSFTSKYNEYQQVRIITAIIPINSLYVEIQLNETIIKPITQVDIMMSPSNTNNINNVGVADTSVEVILLTKNIVFTSSPNVNIVNKTIVGGHFWFYFLSNSNKVQTVHGIDIQNFGQQGILGKYPIHFHFCNPMNGTVISKNTIRHSMQRCIVIHGTNNVTIIDNVAYNTFGHCYMLEDGIETNNRFIRNIGVLTKKPTYIIPSSSIMNNGIESDNEPSTFWITNPSNDFIDNVAAGSINSGYWFELQKRGIMVDSFKNLNPQSDPIGIFRNNVAHSNGQKGIRTYPVGYIPKITAIFDGIKIYRNNVGVFFHISSNLQIQNSYFSDNALSIDLERTLSPPIRLINITVIGESDVYRNNVRVKRFDDVCDIQFELPSYNIGIEVRTWKNRVGMTGSIWKDVEFSNFNHGTCKYVSPISMDYTIRDGTLMFDSYTTMQGVRFNDMGTNKIDLCRANKEDVDDIYLTDLDGSLNPSILPTTTGSSSLVSLRPNMLQFVDQSKCTNVTSKCYSYCQDTCFRGILFEVDPSYTFNFTLKLCQTTNMNNCIVVPGYRRSDEPYLSDRYRYFPAYLPIGQYNAVFLDNGGVESWPSFVRQLITDISCPKFGSHSVTMKEPGVPYTQCIELLRNGNAEASTSVALYWLTQGRGSSGLQLLAGAGVGGTNALASATNATRTIIVQFLDTRCLKLLKNAVYNVYADIQLLHRNGSIYICDPNVERCPDIGIFTEEDGFMNSNDDYSPLQTESGTLQSFLQYRNDYLDSRNYDDESDLGEYPMVEGAYNVVAEVGTASLNMNGFQSIKGSVRITDQLINKEGIRFYIQSYNYRLVVDNLSMKLSNETSYTVPTPAYIPPAPTTTAYTPTTAAYTPTYTPPSPTTTSYIPIDAPVNCFSGSNLVDLRDVGYIPISQVHIGDYIRAGNGNDYTQIYGFGHFNHHIESEFLQIHLVDDDDESSVFEISPNHLLFVNRMINNTNISIVIAAGDVVVNDFLSSKRVRSVHQITRMGVYAPLTQSGDLLVNNIRASNYVKILDNKYNMAWDHHALGHACFLPQRLFCKYFMKVCQKEVYNVNGYGMLASIVVRTVSIINKQGWFVNIIVFILNSLTIMTSSIIEPLMNIHATALLLLVAFVVGITIMKSHGRMTTKN